MLARDLEPLKTRKRVTALQQLAGTSNLGWCVTCLTITVKQVLRKGSLNHGPVGFAF
jgi:hypothetical protein